jgi:hypothetical protein
MNQRGAARKPAIDVYCGVIPADVWPFGEPLVVELETVRGSFFVLDVHVSADLPGLRRFVRSLVKGLPISQVAFISYDADQAVYCAPYWKWVHAALAFAVSLFKEERPSEYWASVYHVRELRAGLFALCQRRAS